MIAFLFSLLVTTATSQERPTRTSATLVRNVADIDWAEGGLLVAYEGNVERWSLNGASVSKRMVIYRSDSLIKRLAVRTNGEYALLMAGGQLTVVGLDGRIEQSWSDIGRTGVEDVALFARNVVVLERDGNSRLARVLDRRTGEQTFVQISSTREASLGFSEPAVFTADKENLLQIHVAPRKSTVVIPAARDAEHVYQIVVSRDMICSLGRGLSIYRRDNGQLRRHYVPPPAQPHSLGPVAIDDARQLVVFGQNDVRGRLMSVFVGGDPQSHVFHRAVYMGAIDILEVNERTGVLAVVSGRKVELLDLEHLAAAHKLGP